MVPSVLSRYRTLWQVDWEYVPQGGALVRPVCCVARELRSGHRVELWEDELRHARCPYDLGPTSLYTGFMVMGDLGCHLTLGWPLPAHVLDLYVEARNLSNGLVSLDHSGLVEVLRRYKLPSIEAAEKEAMRDLILRGGPWTAEEQRDIVRYCASDVQALGALLPRMLPQISLPHALQRGRYLRNAVQVEQRGIPLDAALRQTLAERWEAIEQHLIAEINPSIGFPYEDGHFNQRKFLTWTQQHGMVWPLTPKTRFPSLDQEDLKDLALLYPQVEPFRQLRKTLGQMRLSTMLRREEERNCPGLQPFRSLTGRNQPKTRENILGAAAWLRSLIQPPPGYGMAYIDWDQQEYAIVAVFARDQVMMQGYLSGDPYTAFGKRVGAIPSWGTKATHAAIREVYKACSLGVLYGMGAYTLARRLGKSPRVGTRLLQQHRQTYKAFWRWTKDIVATARAEKHLATVFGWTLHCDAAHQEADSPQISQRTIKNFLAQSHGAEMLRLALCFAVEAGVEVCAPLHDALLIQAPEAELSEAIRATRRAMRDASEVVLGGVALRTDVQAFVSPAHYHDSRGDAMWKIIIPLLGREQIPISVV